MSEKQEPPISQRLLEILRDPVAVQDKEKYGADPGKLELVHNCWLVSADTGYKYPISEGIPVMLIEEGEKWKNFDVDDLPVPPPPLVPQSAPMSMPGASRGNTITADAPNPIFFVPIVLLGLAILWLLVRLLRPRKS